MSTIGSAVPALDLPDTTGRQIGWTADAHRATVVVFTCNHCPYALAWHERLNAVAVDYAPQQVSVLFVNSNDARRVPADGIEAMAGRVAAGELAGPYLHDANQQVARAWGATVTPDVFVVDSSGVLRYHGAPDASFEEPALGASWLRSALDEVLAGAAVSTPETPVRGCSIKWRQDD